MVSGCFRGNGSPLGIDDHVVGINAHFAQHGSHQCGFVFAISVTMQKDIRRWVRLPTTNAQFNRYITDISLHEFGKRTHFLQH